ncbi:helix-turn-helix domain-containing protein [Pusillimonas sp. MFBS29]|uniref:helix-turn-helix domain-containing protein n=1 Tax=Pusillimonas sp. MFBS29 TaxID=2886690 RepID=UPI001D0F70F4|nr:helix-turn-helix domain-containing protein [Pusillimonas sp. MFBS29]MCC2597162.1 helix-turn-helix domain-containing protein [Pusillimonas sp. MFBS29]
MHTNWTTGDVDERNRFDYWRDAISNAFVPLDPLPLDQAARQFNGTLKSLELESFRISTIAADGHEVSLTRNGIARQHGSPFFVNLLRRGRIQVSQYGEQATAAPGDIYVVDSAAPWSVSFTEPFEMFCIEIGEDALRPRLGTRGRLPSPVLSGDSNQILRSYLSMLEDRPAQELGLLHDLVFEHCVALLARSGASADGLAPTQRDSCIMRQQVLSFIDRNITNPDLTPDAVCAAMRISRSYMFKLLSSGGDTFAGYVRRARLHGCRDALLRFPQRPISQIACSWGFGDVSTFNRAYRSEFGETPRDSRSSI